MEWKDCPVLVRGDFLEAQCNHTLALVAAECEAGVLDTIVEVEFVASGIFLFEPRSEFLFGPIAARYQKYAIWLEKRHDAMTVLLTNSAAGSVGF